MLKPEYVSGRGLLRGKSVLITAAAGAGIGFSAALRAAEEGCRALMISDIHDGRLNEAVERIRQACGLQAVYGQVCNVTNEEQVRALVAAAEERLNGVDVLINNAGLGIHGPFEQASEADDMKMIDLNITALTTLTRAFLPGMLERGRGGVLNVASTASFQPMPYFAVYAATKAYVLSFSEGLAEEVRARGVTVTCLCPGPTTTEFVEVSGVGKVDLASKAPMMTAEAVAADGLAALRAGRTVTVPGLMNAVGAGAVKLIPRQWAAKAVGAIFKPSH